MRLETSALSGYLSCGAALSAALGIVATLIAHGLSGTAWAAPLDVAAPLTAHFFIGGIAAVLAMRYRRYALAILAAGVVVALLGHALWADWQPWQWYNAHAASSSSHKALRVYALNTWDAHPDLGQLERALAEVDADILVLAEVDPSKRALIDRLKARFPFQVTCVGRSECAMAVLSRLPIRAGKASRDRYEVPPIAWARIDATSVGLGVVTVVGTHVHRPSRDPRVHALHLRALAAMLVQVQGPLILAGDLNASPWSASFQEFRRDTRLSPVAMLLPTWPMVPLALPQFAIDHIMISRELAVATVRLGRPTGSDHAAIAATLTAH